MAWTLKFNGLKIYCEGLTSPQTNNTINILCFEDNDAPCLQFDIVDNRIVEGFSKHELLVPNILPNTPVVLTPKKEGGSKFEISRKSPKPGDTIKIKVVMGGSHDRWLTVNTDNKLVVDNGDGEGAEFEYSEDVFL